jgi:site-specific DNA-methyltransferase (cytosine-N4-specific)
MTVHYTDDTVTLHHGDALAVLAGLPDRSVDCCVTSPPYFGLRDYGVDGQIGAEQTPAEFIERLRQVFAEVRRVLADDGTCWVNLGDSYSTRKVIRDSSHQPGFHPDRLDHETIGKTWVENRQSGAVRMPYPGIPEKNLLGMPWRLAFALQDDGWILRNAIVWAKPNAMPESVTDRLSTRHELLFLLTKSRRYWFDLDPIREPLVRPEALTEGIVFGGKNPHVGQRRGAVYGKAAGTNLQPTGARHTAGDPAGRNPGDVWSIPTVPFPGSHFAVFPPELPRRCILAGCRPGGTVLDPFHGSGTTGMVAQQLGRRYVGIDLNAEYLDLSLRTRLADGVLDFDGGVA